MKKLLLATTILATALTSAHADVKEFYHSGYWHNYVGRGQAGTAVCGMNVIGIGCYPKIRPGSKWVAR